MNPAQTYNNYLERYGEDEGLSLYIQFLEFMQETSDFPTCLIYSEEIRKTKEEL